MSLKVSNAACTAAENYRELLSLESSELDRIVTKTCTFKPIPKPRKPIWKVSPIYSLNNFGLGNSGYDFYSSLSFPDKIYTISITGSYKEIRQIATYSKQPDFLEINISCPNSNKEIVSLEDLCYIPFKTPFGIKLPPLFSKREIHETAGSLNVLKILQSNLKYVVCCNTLPMEGGGVGGKILKPISLYNIKEVSTFLRKDIQIWGCGGISSVEDLQEYENADCYGVQIATSLIHDGLDYVNNFVYKYRS